MRYSARWLWLIAVGLVASGGYPRQAIAAEGATAKLKFTDITAKAGFNQPRAARVAWGDYNNDGLEDLLVNGCWLYKNLGNGRFTNVTDAAHLPGAVPEKIWLDVNADGLLEGVPSFKAPSGGVWADVDNDGFLDFVAIGGQVANCSLWKSNGDGTFTNATKAMGFESDKNRPTQGAAWGDFDRDGFVDLYLANYEKSDADLSQGNPDVFWKNDRARAFVDVTQKAGLVVPKPVCGRGVAWADYNNDGWLDIYVSNYRLAENFLWQNRGDGTFTNVANEAVCEGDEKPGVFGHTIGSAWADFNNDGYLDLLCPQLAHPQFRKQYGHPMTMLYVNSGPPQWKFTNVNTDGKAGIAYHETHANAAVGDLDNDGFLDICLTSVYQGERFHLYRNRGDLTFEEVTSASDLRVSNGFGCAWADIDNDGDLDLVTGRYENAQLNLLRNDLPKGINHWLEVSLTGSDCNRAAIGARVTVQAGAATYLREIEGGSATTCQNSLRAHFGLGKHPGEVEVTVRWPCGRIQKLRANPDQLVSLKEAAGAAEPAR